MTAGGFAYLEYPPAAGRAQKLVVLVHGYGVNAGFMEKMAREVQRQIPDALVVCPQAPDIMSLPEKGSKTTLPPPREATRPPAGLTRSMQREWFSIVIEPAQMHQKLKTIAQDMNIFIDGLRDRHGLKDSDIALMGFSQGGAVALYTGLMRKAPPGAVVGHSSLLLDHKDFTARPPVLVIYGTGDKTFETARYEQQLVAPLQQYLGSAVQIERINGLGHSTSEKSRRIAAGFIKKNLTP